MDFIGTTDHIQSRPGSIDHNMAPHDLSKPITNLSEYKGAAPPRGRANAGHAPDQYATDTRPSSLITRMTKDVLATQRRQLASQPASSRDTRMAEHYKATYVLEDRGGATAPGAELSLRPTGKAAGGMNPGQMTRDQMRVEMAELRGNIRQAIQEYNEFCAEAENAMSSSERRLNLNLAQASLDWKKACERRYDVIMFELEARSGRSGGSSRF